jgi:hypothetical protein
VKLVKDSEVNEMLTELTRAMGNQTHVETMRKMFEMPGRPKAKVIMATLRRDLLAKHGLDDDLQALARMRRILRREVAVVKRRIDTAIMARGSGAVGIEAKLKPAKRE